MKKTLIFLLSAILVLSMLMGTLVSCTTTDGTGDNGDTEGDAGNTDEKETKYVEALKMLTDGNYAGAYEAFKSLGDYLDCQARLEKFVYFPSVVNYDLSEKSGVMTVTLGENNLPSNIVSDGTIGKKDGTYTYSATGNLKKQKVIYNGEELAYAYTHDLNNNMIKAEYSVNGTVTAVYEYSYDPQGNLESELYSENGALNYDCNYYYDSNGNLIKLEVNTTGVDYVYTYVYDADGYKISERGEATNGNWYTKEFSYDAEGKLTKERYTEGDSLYIITYTYDDAGNCIKAERTYEDGSVDVITKEYDANGNAIKEISTSADGSVETVETQYVLTYLEIDVPKQTMDQLWGILTITT